jgi:chromosome segregation ATPase
MRLTEVHTVSEDPTKRLSGESNGSDELFRLVQAIRTELLELKQTVNARLHDTRPIWEKVQADIAHLQEGQQQLDKRLEALRDETRTGFRNLKRQFGVLLETFLEVQADYKELDKRIYRFEEPLEEPHN